MSSEATGNAYPNEHPPRQTSPTEPFPAFDADLDEAYPGGGVVICQGRALTSDSTRTTNEAELNEFAFHTVSLYLLDKLLDYGTPAEKQEFVFKIGGTSTLQACIRYLLTHRLLLRCRQPEVSRTRDLKKLVDVEDWNKLMEEHFTAGPRSWVDGDEVTAGRWMVDQEVWIGIMEKALETGAIDEESAEHIALQSMDFMDWTCLTGRVEERKRRRDLEERSHQRHA